MFHPIEVNYYWQQAAKNLVASGYQYRRIENSIIPGVFEMKDVEPVYLIADSFSRSTQVWIATSASQLPNEFNPRFASAHAGVSVITIKTEIGKGRLPARRAGKRALIISDADLLLWARSRPSRGCASRTSRTQSSLMSIAHKSLKSMLRAAIYRFDVDFQRLFKIMKENGVGDPESLMFSDIQAFHGALNDLSRQALIAILEE